MSFFFFSANAEHVNKIIYNSYVYKDMNRWKSIIDSLQLENEKNILNISEKWELLNYQYGYIAWAISNKKEKKSDAEKYLAIAENNLEELEELIGKTPTINAYHSAFIAYDIGITPFKAPFIGLKSMKYGEMAVEEDSLNYFALIQYGNIMNYMPAAFGGSKSKALMYYLEAKKIMDEDPKLHQNNWLYMNLILTIADNYKNSKNYESTMKYYNVALKIHPDYPYVKDILIPSLEEKMTIEANSKSKRSKSRRK